MPFLAFLLIPGTFFVLPIVVLRFPGLLPSVFQNEAMKVASVPAHASVEGQPPPLRPALTEGGAPGHSLTAKQDAAAGNVKLHVNIANLLLQEAKASAVATGHPALAPESWDRLMEGVRSDAVTYEDAAAPAIALGETVWSPSHLSGGTAQLAARYMGVPSAFMPGALLVRHLNFVRSEDAVGRGRRQQA